MDHTSKKGLITALSCYIIWGLLPLYWALLNHVSPYNICLLYTSPSPRDRG